MGKPGLGVMIQMLGGNSASVAAWKAAVGDTIRSVAVKEDALHFEFESGYKMRLVDQGQSCCEHQYMVCDDDLSYHVGAVLHDAEIKTAAEQPHDEYGEHEIQFLVVTTSKGQFTVANHNEHNGYYGGFWVVAEAVQ